MRNLVTSAVVCGVAFLAGCQEEDDNNAPPVLSGGTGDTVGDTATSGSGSTAGTDSGATSGDGDGDGDVCPGYGSYSRDVAVWAVLENPTATPEPQFKLQSLPGFPTARCATVTQCVADENEADVIDGLGEGCDALTIDQIKGLGFMDEPPFFIVDHICSNYPQIFSDENPWEFGAIEPSAVQACTDDPNTEDQVENAPSFIGSCAAGDCPGGGGDESGESGAVDSTGDTGDTEAAAFDCSAFSGLSYTEQVARNSTTVERRVVVERSLADLLLEQPYEALYFCGQALVSSEMVIHKIDRGSPLRDIGLVPYDTLERVCSNGNCSTVATGMYDLMAGPLEFGGEVEITLQRGGSKLVYILNVRPPA